MSRVRACVAAVLALGAVLLPAPAQAQPPVAGTAAEDFGGCLRAQGTGDLLVLLDESSSLATNDPGAARVTAARYLLTGLQDSVARSGVTLDVAVAGFAEDYRPAVDWTPLSAQTLPALTAGVEGFAQRRSGGETDYWNALEGARRVLAARPPSPAGPAAQRCQSVVWLTDGQLDIAAHPANAPRKAYAPDIDPSRGADVEQRAAQELCRPGGLTTQLRSAGVRLFGIGLSADAGDSGRFDLMKSITTGKQGPDCAPSTGQPGAFFPAADVDGLLLAIDAILPGARPSPARPLCASLPCAERHVVVLDSSVTAVHVLGQVDIPDAQAVLQLPSGETLDLGDRAPGTHVLDRNGLVIRYTWLSPRTVSIDLAAEPGVAAWPGVWALVFLDPSSPAPRGTSRASIRISSDLQPVWTDRPPELRVGDRVPVRLGLVDGRQRPVDPLSLPGTVAVSAVFVDPDGREAPLATALDRTRLAEPVPLDLGQARQGPARLRLQLDLTTVDARLPDGTVVAGTPIAPRIVDLPLTIGPKLGYPTVTPRITFPLTESTTAETALTVDPPGCVWVAPRRTTITSAPTQAGAPVAVDVVALDAVDQGSCRSGPVPLRLTAAEAANGAVTGQVVVTARPDDPSGPPIEVAVEFSGELRKPVDELRFWLVFAAVAALGIAIPLLLMTLAKAWTGRIPARPISAVRAEVRIADGAVVHPDGSPFTLSGTRGLDTWASDPKELVVAGVRLRRRIGQPFGPATVRATVPGTPLVSASSRAPWFDRSLRAVLPLAVHGCWVVLHDPHGPPDRAEVLLLFAGDVQLDAQETLVDDLRATLPAVLGRLRDRAGRRGGGRPPTPDDGRATGLPEASAPPTNTFAGRGR